MMTLEEKEHAFTTILHKAAEENGMVFVEESGEGHGRETDYLFLEDVSGWLFPKGTTSEEQADDKWFVFAEWKLEGNNVIIDFVKR